MSIEARLEALTAAVEANTEQLKVMNAGREAALEQLKGAADAGAAAPAKRTRGKKADEATADTAGNSTGDAAGSADTASGAGVATPVAEPVGVSEDDLRNAAQSYIGGAGDDKPARQARGTKIKEITNHFGTETLVGATGITDPEQRKQALFFLKRLTAGAEVNFSAEYDFDGDPSQEVGAADDVGDDFNIG